MAQLIASDSITVPSEEKVCTVIIRSVLNCYCITVQVFESVISWINHSTEQRAQNLPMLIEHVRLPLLSQDYLIHKVRLIKTLDILCCVYSLGGP